jgi:hypothetical protein
MSKNPIEHDKARQNKIRAHETGQPYLEIIIIKAFGIILEPGVGPERLRSGKASQEKTTSRQYKTS